MQIIIAKKKDSDVPETLFPSCVCDEADTNRRIQYFMRRNVTAAQSLSVLISLLGLGRGLWRCAFLSLTIYHSLNEALIEKLFDS